VIPSGLVITRLPLPPLLTATNKLLPLTVPYVTDCQALAAAAVRIVQVSPSGLVITRSNPDEAKPTATNKLLPYVTPYQLLSAADIWLVQVIPSGLVITRLPTPLPLTATNKPLPLTVPYVTDCQSLSASGDPDLGVV
jgi:hypothetical protein